MKGYVHSIETFGTVDGPGIRYVLFTQGCLLRCKYCHNADTWEIGTGKEMNVADIVKDIQTYLPFIESSGGGVTVSGGEPLLQIPFLIELFKECKKIGVHTTIDSSGGCYSSSPLFQEQLLELLKWTDLILLDIKHIDRKKHLSLTGMTNDHILDFAHFLSEHHMPVWIRHVLVPSITDYKEDLLALGAFIRTLDNVEKFEILPYHKLGIYKWEALDLEYPLKDINPPTEQDVNLAYKMVTGTL
ncbi:pyruvate formate-lyase-activating protein [Bacillus sp. 03113]|uniref:pyruvate formate-lyase-activating protein n=1 Tax=Bacillus sp. 03113 TaxID=2578211 RepID=UPI001144DD71|nr:pyruvate formate-lyase-activating protein [Bacillus sp. 03113]